MQQDDIVRFVT